MESATPPLIDPVAPEQEHAPQKPNKPFWVAWGIVFLVFALMISMSLKDVVGANPEDKSQVEALIRTVRLGYTTQAALPSEGRRTQGVVNEQQLRDALKDARAHIKGDPEAATFVLFLEKELGLPLTGAALSELKKDKEKTSASVVEFYDLARQNPKRSAELAKQLKDESGVLSLVRYQALKASGNKSAMAEVFGSTNTLMLLGIVAVFGVGLLCLGVVAIVAYAISLPNLPLPEHPVVVRTGLQAGLLGLILVVCYIGFQMFVAAGASFGLTPAQMAEGDFSIDSPAIGIAALLFAVALAFVLMRWQWNGESMWRALHKPKFSIGKLWLWGIGGYVANIPILGLTLLISGPLLQRFPPSHPASDAVTQMDNPQTIVVLLVLAGLVAPFWEEIAFRGFLFRGLAHHMSWVWAAVLSSFAFAAIHPQGPALWLGLGWVGFMGCLLVRHTGSIWPAILMHALHNSTLLLFGLALRDVA